MNSHDTCVPCCLNVLSVHIYDQQTLLWGRHLLWSTLHTSTSHTSSASSVTRECLSEGSGHSTTLFLWQLAWLRWWSVQARDPRLCSDASKRFQFCRILKLFDGHATCWSATRRPIGLQLDFVACSILNGPLNIHFYYTILWAMKHIFSKILIRNIFANFCKISRAKTWMRK